MVRLISLCIYRRDESKQKDAPATSIVLAETMDLSTFSFFTRGTIKEHLHFGSRTVVTRTEPGSRQTVALKDIPFLVHAYVRVDGLACVCIADEEYPKRVAFSLMGKTLDTFEEKIKDKWKKCEKDQDLEIPFMRDDMAKFQDPNNADALTKVKKNLEEVKEVMTKNIEELMHRGETLDSLMDKSSDLSSTSVQFYKKAKETNACCRV